MAVRSEAKAATVAESNLSTLLEICACPDCTSRLEEFGSALRCTNCGHEFEMRGKVPMLLPQKTDATGDRYLANYKTMATDDLAKPFEGNRPARHRRLMEFVGSVAGMRVLDIGSSDAGYLRQMDAAQKVALDIAIEYLLEIPSDAGVIAICGDAERLPLKAGQFDVIIISDVLEHVLHPERVVQHLERICLDDTRLIVHVPWEEDLTQYRDLPYEFTHLRSFDAFSFQRLFRPFYERRSRGTYPRIIPLPYPFYGRIPRFVYNLAVFAQHTKLAVPLNRRLERWGTELPRREWWLLLLYKPIFRMFELRLLSGTPRYRIYRWLRSRLKPTRT
jgi:SAM-dependent methyltransferase